MLVTAVIPVHNHARWVNDAINSIINQTYPHKQIVVIDDGSTDGSSEAVVARMSNMAFPAQQGEPWVCKGIIDGVEVMLNKFSIPHGPAFARNWGIGVASDSDYFAFLDSDDMYEPTKIEKSVKILKEHPSIGAVYSDYETFNEEGRIIREFKPSFSREVLLKECIVNCDSVVSRVALEKAGLFDESMRVAEDYDEWIRISEHFLIAHIPEALVKIRVGSHSSSATVHSDVWRKSHQRIVEKLKARHCSTS